MKKILFVLAFLFISISAFARPEYLTFYLDNGNYVYYSYGNMPAYEPLKDSAGKKMKSSDVSFILNYFAKRGWTYVGYAEGNFIMSREVQE